VHHAGGMRHEQEMLVTMTSWEMVREVENMTRLVTRAENDEWLIIDKAGRGATVAPG